jgi:hypothetical protein
MSIVIDKTESNPSSLSYVFCDQKDTDENNNFLFA